MTRKTIAQLETELQQQKINNELLVQQANQRIQEVMVDRDSKLQVQASEFREDLAAKEIVIAEITKERDSAKSSYKYSSENASELRGQIEAMHDILDVIPSVVPRKKENDQYGGENKIIVRLASLLAGSYKKKVQVAE